MIETRKREKLQVLSALLIAAIGCGSDTTRAPTGRLDLIDSAGVTLAVNYGPDKVLDWKVEQLFRLTGPDGQPKEFTTLRRQHIAVDSAGHIWVLDAAEDLIYEFSIAGEELRSLGHEGTFVAFNADGTPRLDPPPREAGGLVQSARNYGEGRLLLEVSRRGHDPLTRVQTLDIAGREDTIRLLSTRLERRPAAFESCGVSIAMPPLFAKRLGWFTNGRSVVATREAEYMLDLFNGDTLAMRISRDIPVRLTSADMAVRDLGEGMSLGVGDRTCLIPPEEVADKLGMAGSLPVVDDVAMAPDGTIWVKRQSFPDEPGKIDIFSSDGRYQGTLMDLVTLPAAFLPDGGFLTIDLDSLDVPRVSARRLVH